jgi:hypothetical protein
MFSNPLPFFLDEKGAKNHGCEYPFCSSIDSLRTIFRTHPFEGFKQLKIVDFVRRLLKRNDIRGHFLSAIIPWILLEICYPKKDRTTKIPSLAKRGDYGVSSGLWRSFRKG